MSKSNTSLHLLYEASTPERWLKYYHVRLVELEETIDYPEKAAEVRRIKNAIARHTATVLEGTHGQHIQQDAELA